MVVRAVVFDLDDTLIDTFALSAMRTSRRWKEAVSALHKTVAFPGVPELIRSLDLAGVPWAVVTTSVSFYANAVLAHHGLRPATLVAFHDAPAKPSPEPVAKALATLAVQPAEALAIGDSASDLAAYRAAGVRSVRAAWCVRSSPGDWDYHAAEPGQCSPLIFGA